MKKVSRVLAALALLAFAATALAAPHPDSIIVLNYSVARTLTIPAPFEVRIDSTFFTVTKTFTRGVLESDTTFGRP